MFCDNCKKEWKNHCEYYTSDMAKNGDLEIVPVGYVPYLDEYKERGIISGEKNDQLLIKYIVKNNLLQKDICYFRLAHKLLIKNDKHGLLEHRKLRENVEFLIDYMTHSFGYPYDGNNKLRKYVGIMPIERKCYCYPKNWNYEKCHEYIKEIFDDEGRLCYKENERYLYIFRDYIGKARNDEKLLKFIKENYKGYVFCYKSISLFIVRQIDEDYDIFMGEKILSFIMSYLYWSYGTPFDDNNILKTYFEDKCMENVSVMHEEFDKMKRIKQKKSKEERPTIKKIKNKTIKVLVNKRVSQGFFRKKLVDKYGCCQICGMDIIDLLKSSHSKPFKDCNLEEALYIYNGLLLCPGHDSVYDKGYISFNDDGSIILSKYLSEENKKRFNITNDIKIKLESKHSEYLEYHRKFIFRK